MRQFLDCPQHAGYLHKSSRVSRGEVVMVPDSHSVVMTYYVDATTVFKITYTQNFGDLV